MLLIIFMFWITDLTKEFLQQQLNNAAVQTNQTNLIRQLLAENAYNFVAFQNIYNHLNAIHVARMYSKLATSNLFQNPSSEPLDHFSRTPTPEMASPVAAGGTLDVALPVGQDKRGFLPFNSVQSESSKIACQSVDSNPLKSSLSVSVSLKEKPVSFIF